MNTSSLKSFAPAVRTQLMEAAGRKLDYVLNCQKLEGAVQPIPGRAARKK